MRMLMIATLTAAGISLVCTSDTFAAPANGAAIRGAAEAATPVEQAWWVVRRRWYCHRGRVFLHWGRC
jgi:hypothetical protein